MIEAKGRNGYFRVDELEVWKINRAAYDRPDTLHIALYSKRKGEAAPLMIQGNLDEIKWMITELAAATVEVNMDNPRNFKVNQKE